MPHPSSHDGTPTTPGAEPGATPAPPDLGDQFSVRLDARSLSSHATPGPLPRGRSVTHAAPLLDEDPELAGSVPEDEREHAIHALRADIHRLDRGAVELADLGLSETTVALLVTSGTIALEVSLGDRAISEPLVDGDVLLLDPPSPTVPDSRRRLFVLEPARLAGLDHRFLQAGARWPGLVRTIMSRLSDQQQRIAAHGAICQLPRVEQRIVAILHHLAARSGTVTADGVLLHQRLSHQQLADLIGARRPTVSLAVTALDSHGLLHRRDDGSWLLPGYTGEPISVESLIPTVAAVPDGAQ